MTTIYVGNLPFTATEDEVRSIFERHGKVESVKLINDRETGRPRGFAFVDMPSNKRTASKWVDVHCASMKLRNARRASPAAAAAVVVAGAAADHAAGKR